MAKRREARRMARPRRASPPPRQVRTTTSQNWEAVSRRARTQASYTLVSLDSRLESNEEEEKKALDKVA